MYYEVGHVPNKVGGEADVEEHAEDIEDLLSSVCRVDIPVANGGKGGERPIHGIGVA